MAPRQKETVLPIIKPPDDYGVDIDMEIEADVYAILEEEAKAHECSVGSLLRGITNEYATELRKLGS